MFSRSAGTHPSGPRLTGQRAISAAAIRLPSFGKAEPLDGRERLSRPRPEAIERELRLLPGFDVNEGVVVFLLGRLALPIEIRRIVRRHLNGCPARENRVLFRGHRRQGPGDLILGVNARGQAPFRNSVLIPACVAGVPISGYY